MAYTVLARKYRSQTFSEVIGQEPIATTLVNAIKAGRIHHGYLFTGTRGVGKTSMARILAKALNCGKYDAPTTTPCGECDICRSIAEGQDVDVLEIDAASNTGVDNIRELRSNTAYRPARARFKVYIIDEVHMLSTGAFNALLKTLEEPPEHVKFILATTEIQKVPATIRSRCQGFTFRNIGPDAIAGRLREIVKAEGATADEAVIQRVARLAAGSMRDALSILDQLLSVSPKHLDAAVLDELLPPAQDERIFALLGHAADGDVAAMLNDLDGIVGGGRGLENFCQDAVEIVRTLMLIQTCGPDAALVDIPAGQRDAYVALAGRFELSHYIQMIAMLEELRRNVRYSGAGRALTEAALARLARLRAWSSIEELLKQLPAGGVGHGGPALPPGSRPAAVDEKKKPANGGPGNDVATGLRAQRAGAALDGATPAVVAVAAVKIANPVPRPDPLDGVPEADDYHPADEVPAPEFSAAAPAAASEASEPMSRPRLRDASPEQRARARQDALVRQALDLFDGSLVDVKTVATPGTVIAPGGPAE